MTERHVPTSDEIAEMAVRIFPLMGRLMEARMRVTERGFGMSPVHFHVLNMIDHQPHTLNEIADRQKISSASLSRSVTVMEERGWVNWDRSTEDRRVVYISITPSGHKILRDIEDRSRDYLVSSFEGLSDDERTELMRGLDILIGAFSDSLTRLPSDED